jgi:hypothetical protein
MTQVSRRSADAKEAGGFPDRSPRPEPDRGAGRARREQAVRLEGFDSRESRAPDGSIETEQRVSAPVPVVPFSDEGGRTLGRRYWLEVSRVARGLVVAHVGDAGVEVRLAGLDVTLLRLGPGDVTVESDRVTCRYPLRGGLLSRVEGGQFAVAQIAGERTELSVAVSGFFARRGVLYRHLQRRLHIAVSRRYFRRMVAGDSL